MSIKLNDDGTPTAFPSILNAPTGFNIIDASTTATTMSTEWTAPGVQGTAIGFRVYSGVNKVGEVAWGTTSLVVTALTPETEYTLHVVTYDTLGESSDSNTDVDTTLVSTETIFYENDFSTGTFVTNTPYPVFQVADVGDNSIEGAGNIYEIDNTIFRTNSYSLKLNMDGRNGLANVPISGSAGDWLQDSRAHHASPSYGGTVYFVDSVGADLTAIDANYVNASSFQVGDYIYNLSNGFSKWQIDSIYNENATNDACTLTLITGPIASIGGTAEFNNNDIVTFSGEDRATASTPPSGSDTRRSDFNNAIGSFYNSGAYLSAGTSYFKRYYLRFNVTTCPFIHMKIGYFAQNGGDPIYGYSPVFLQLGSSTGTTDNMKIELDGQKDTPGAVVSFISNVVNDQWYYAEVEYRSDSTPGASDGYMRVWFGEEGSEPLQNSPTFTTETDYPGGVLLAHIDNGSRIALWGNIQHYNVLTGSINIDNVKVSDTFIGPA